MCSSTRVLFITIWKLKHKTENNYLFIYTCIREWNIFLKYYKMHNFNRNVKLFLFSFVLNRLSENFALIFWWWKNKYQITFCRNAQMCHFVRKLLEMMYNSLYMKYIIHIRDAIPPIESWIKRKLRKLFGHSMDVTLPVVASLSLRIRTTDDCGNSLAVSFPMHNLTTISGHDGKRWPNVIVIVL